MRFENLMKSNPTLQSGVGHDIHSGLDFMHRVARENTKLVKPISVPLPSPKKRGFLFLTKARIVAYSVATFFAIVSLTTAFIGLGTASLSEEIQFIISVFVIGLFVYAEFLVGAAYYPRQKTDKQPHLEMKFGVLPIIRHKVRGIPDHKLMPKGVPIKRLIDIVGASIALVFFAPLLLVVAAIIKIQDPKAEALFLHTKRGFRGQKFECFKLRTMVPDAERKLRKLIKESEDLRAEWEECQKLYNDPRVTSFGRFLRKTSIDELPQLINILRGDMSLVGPRPIDQKCVLRYGEQIAYYDAVRPGLTGLWQVSGRSFTTFEERVDLDVRYVREYSLICDLKIIAKTVPTLLTAKGAM